MHVQRQLLWALGGVVCLYILVQTWVCVQWLFMSIQESIPPSTTGVPGPHVRYEREYTALKLAIVATALGYVMLLARHRFCASTVHRAAPTDALTLTSSQTPLLYSEDQLEQGNMVLDGDPMGNGIASEMVGRKTGSLPGWYLSFRRVWCYEWSWFGGSTVQLGETALVVGLAGIHALLILCPPLASSVSDHVFFHHQLISNRVGQMALIDLTLAVALSVRTSAVWRFIGLSDLRSTITWHRWFALAGVICTLYHGCFQFTKHYYRHYLEKQALQQVVSATDLGGSMDVALFASMTWWQLVISSKRYFTGCVLAFAVFAAWLSAHPLVRAVSYTLFRIVHVGAMVLIVAAAAFHHKVMLIFYSAVFLIWCVDLVIRWRSTKVNVVALEPVAPNVVHMAVALPVPLQITPGAFVYCGFHANPVKNLMFSHPFSISRVVPRENDATRQTMSFYIKVNGRHTARLYEMAKDNKSAPIVRVGRVLGTNAFAPPFDAFSVIVLVAHGIGITPWLAALQASRRKHANQLQQRVYVIWSLRDRAAVHAMVQDADLDAHWQVYVTNRRPDDDENGENDDDKAMDLDQMYLEADKARDDDGHGTLETLDAIQYHAGRPLYTKLLHTIRERHPNDNVFLGLCANQAAIAQCGNLARSTAFSNENAYWAVHAERFEYL
ncbi:hypothetical protein BC940DRAFT_301360 [Gongronella butleri]|nr:hypothetical protein BC940DRAFT_301360 [Gongronella butleri]